MAIRQIEARMAQMSVASEENIDPESSGSRIKLKVIDRPDHILIDDDANFG